MITSDSLLILNSSTVRNGCKRRSPPEIRQFLIKRLTQAVTFFNFMKLEYRSTGTIGDNGTITEVRQVFFNSSLISVDGSRFLGQVEGLSCNHSGPFHHNSCSNNSEGRRPLEAQSAGLFNPSTCLHRLGGIQSMMSEIRFPTKVLKRLGLPFSQLSTIVLSVHA